MLAKGAQMFSRQVACANKHKITRASPRTSQSVKTRNVQTWSNVDTKVVTLLPGDGVGPEITDATVGVIQAAKAPVEFERFDLGGPYEPENITETSELISSISRNGIALKGPLFTPVGSKRYTRNLQLRRVFELSALYVPCYSLEGVETRHKDVDLVVIRENTEGEYSGLEQELVPGVVQSLKVTTEKASLLVAQRAFDYAVENARKKVTAIHKANIQKVTDGLFLESCRAVAEKYPNIEYTEMIVDNTCMQLVMNPSQFDIMVTPNLYGTVVANVAAGLVGGPGLTPGANIGDKVAIFEPGCRHAGMDIRGKNVANPTAMILSGAMMLRHMELDRYADMIENALKRVLKEDNVKTMDLGGTATTKEFTKRVIDSLDKK